MPSPNTPRKFSTPQPIYYLPLLDSLPQFASSPLSPFPRQKRRPAFPEALGIAGRKPPKRSPAHPIRTSYPPQSSPAIARQLSDNLNSATLSVEQLFVIKLWLYFFLFESSIFPLHRLEIERRLPSVCQAELPENLVDVRLDRLVADKQLLGDLSV